MREINESTIKKIMKETLRSAVKEQVVEIQGNFNGNGDPEVWIYFRKGSKMFAGLEANMTTHHDDRWHGNFLLESSAMMSPENPIGIGACFTLGSYDLGEGGLTKAVKSVADFLDLVQREELAS